MNNVIKNEILAPVGNMDAFYAALTAGCDAVYLAGKMFGARAFSKNFTNEELVYIINYAHLYGVRVYVTCNILIYESEVEKFLEFVEFLHKNNVDALIMQDIGMIDLVHKTFPNLELHGSTQMHIHNLDGAKMAEKLGLKRIVLARETPIEVIKEIKENTNIDLEIFVHGALCASFSGMCLFASSIGPRSGNRGTCSGCCRLPYDVLDKNGNILNTGKYPLSMKDLKTIDYLNELIDLGITSFKIEGRMKSASYVYITTKIYKETRDNYLKNKEIKINKDDIKKLNTIFNRTYTKGFLFHDKDVTNDNFPNHQGIKIGEVIDYKNNHITIKLLDDISIHDGLRITNENYEYGFLVNEFYINKKQVYEAKKNDIISLKVNKNIKVGSNVLKTSSYKIEEEIKDIINKKERKIPISFDFKAIKNVKIELTIRDNIHKITLYGNVPEISKNKEITKEAINNKLMKVKNTIYEIKEININLDNNLFFPISELNHLKQDIIEKLNKKRINSYKKNFIKQEYYINLKNYPEDNLYSILTNNKENISNKYSIIYSEVLDNSIIKIPKVMNNYNNYLTDKEYLTGEIGSLNKLNNVITDYSFNVTNSYSVAYLHSLGVKRVTLSLEIPDKEIKNLINNYHDRYHKHPNLELITKTKKEVMVLKYNFDKYKNACYLRDRFGNDYKIVKKGNVLYLYDYKETKREKEDDHYFKLGINVLREEYYE